MKKAEPVKLPKGWDSELRKLDSEIEETRSSVEALNIQMEQEIENIRSSYKEKMPWDKLQQLHQSRDMILQAIRDNYSISHPSRSKKFRTYQEAARVLAHYWPVLPYQRGQLVDKISTDAKFANRAYDLATMLTHPNSPERDYVNAANNFLWKDVGK